MEEDNKYMIILAVYNNKANSSLSLRSYKKAETTKIKHIKKEALPTLVGQMTLYSPD